MSDTDLSDDEVDAEVTTELAQSSEFIRRIRLDDIQSGEWFVLLLQAVVSAYERNTRVAYFQQKYPGLTEDALADKLISVTARYAAVAGAVAGVTTSINQISLLASGGLTTTLLLSAIGAEFTYLARIQIRLILDLSVVYDLQLNPDDPEDVLMIMGFALGIGPAELTGRGLQIAAGSLTRSFIRTYISKGTLKSIQGFARQLGFKILQRTMIKYMVPGVSAAVGSSYNYLSTRSVGQIAQAHFKNRGVATEELRQLVSRQTSYELLFPAMLRYLAEIDGNPNPREQELYQAMVSRMSFDAHTQREFELLTRDESTMFEQLSAVAEPEKRQTLLDLLILMAIYDGELVEAEEAFLLKTAAAMDIPLDKTTLHVQAAAYQLDLNSGSMWQRLIAKTGEAFQGIGQHAQSVSSRVVRAIQVSHSTRFGLFRHAQLQDNITDNGAE